MFRQAGALSGLSAGFAEQLEVIRTLERWEVSVVVVMHDPTDYFVEKSADATRVLRDCLATRCYRERRIGPYDVLRRYGSGPLRLGLLQRNIAPQEG